MPDIDESLRESLLAEGYDDSAISQILANPQGKLKAIKKFGVLPKLPKPKIEMTEVNSPEKFRKDHPWIDPVVTRGSESIGGLIGGIPGGPGTMAMGAVLNPLIGYGLEKLTQAKPKADSAFNLLNLIPGSATAKLAGKIPGLAAKVAANPSIANYLGHIADTGIATGIDTGDIDKALDAMKVSGVLGALPGVMGRRAEKAIQGRTGLMKELTSAEKAPLKAPLYNIQSSLKKLKNQGFDISTLGPQEQALIQELEKNNPHKFYKILTDQLFDARDHDQATKYGEKFLNNIATLEALAKTDNASVLPKVRKAFMQSALEKVKPKRVIPTPIR